MYSEKTFKNYIFWIQVKRVFLIILLSCIGAGLGVFISELYESIMKSNQFNVAIIVVSTVIMFFISLLLTAGTGKEVQDGYWKIAVLRKLTTIQKLIETNNALVGNNENITTALITKEEINKISNLSPKKSKKKKEIENNNDLEYEEDIVEIEENKENKDNKENDSSKKETEIDGEEKSNTEKNEETV